MDLFRFRLEEVKNALVDHDLIPDDSLFTLNGSRSGEEPIRFFSQRIERHQLTVIGYADGEISLALLDLDEQYTNPTCFLALITTTDGHAWTIRLSGDFADTCSSTLYDAWKSLPPRIDDEEGLFGLRTGRIAVNNVISTFCKLAS